MAIPVDMVIEETVRELEEVFGRRLRILERVAITAALEQLIDTIQALRLPQREL